MTKFTITTTVTCGKTTCAVRPGKFCPHFGSKEDHTAEMLDFDYVAWGIERSGV